MSPDPFDEESGGEGLVFRDVVFLALFGFLVMLFIVIPFVNPPTKKQDAKPPGNVIVEVYWKNNINVDVDTWVRAPGDVPVGYSNRSGKIFDLLRDDLGTDSDISGRNYENAYSRGIVPGEYVVNLHLFSIKDGTPPPIEVLVVVSVRTGDEQGKGALKQILYTKVLLLRQGQELTVFRFKLTEKGELVEGSVHNLPIEIRSGNTGPG